MLRDSLIGQWVISLWQLRDPIQMTASMHLGPPVPHMVQVSGGDPKPGLLLGAHTGVYENIYVAQNETETCG